MKKKRKSKFQQRLEEMQKKHTEFSEDSGPSKVNLHNEETGDTGDPESPTAQDDRVWVSCDLNPPPYYAPVDIWIGSVLMTEGNVCKDWHRVSDGEWDYYCNQRDNTIVTDPTHWRKRQGVNYPRYKPLTGDDIKRITYRELLEVRDTLEKEMIPTVEVQYNEGFNEGLLQGIKAINNLIRTKRMTD